jgi:hypothetical protein
MAENKKFESKMFVQKQEEPITVGISRMSLFSQSGLIRALLLDLVISTAEGEILKKFGINYVHLKWYNQNNFDEMGIANTEVKFRIDAWCALQLNIVFNQPGDIVNFLTEQRIQTEIEHRECEISNVKSI